MRPETPDEVMAKLLWPPLPVEEWAPTRDTVQLWAQIVGKVRLAHSPLLNHWWNVPLYVTARGLTTSLMWAPDGRGFQVDFDFVDHNLLIDAPGARRTVALGPRTVASFYSEFVAKLDEVGIDPEIWAMPVEIPGAIPFDQDNTHKSYDRDHVSRFWQALVSSCQIFYEFRTKFVGKASPVHLFWGALDLATTRFSGRRAPQHPGGAPNCAPHVMHEAYSHEVSSAGYWPGGAREGAFYSYAYPEPDGFAGATIKPGQAFYDGGLREFVLPYEAVRSAEDPAATLLSFLESTYDAAASLGRWDRASLERELPSWAHSGIARHGRSPGAAST